MTQQGAVGHCARVTSQAGWQAGRFPEPLAARIDLASENRRCSLPLCCAVYVTYWAYVTPAFPPSDQQSHAWSTCDLLDSPILR